MRSGLYRGLFIMFLFLLPLQASAKVLISEVMYNPDGADDKHEWIELFNGYNAPVDISKWKINDGSNHIFNVPPKNGGTGSLTITSGGYLILAGDAATFLGDHSGISVSVIDTAISLGNTAETISLLRDDGTTEDRVSYTKDMGAYDDGNSLQRGSVTSGSLVAGAPTPGTGTLSGDSSAPPASASSQDETANSASASDSASSASAKKVSPPAAEVFADAGDDRTVAVGADVVFQGRVYDRKKNVLDDVRYVWNFGDGASAEGPTVKHHYSYPGTYVAVLSAADEAFSISDKVKVTAEPAQMVLIALPDGGVELKNTSAHDRDLSNWIINANGRLFTLPKDTAVLGKSSIFVSSETMGFKSDSDTLLEYPNGTRVTSLIAQVATSSEVFTAAPLPIARAAQNIPYTGSDPIAYAPVHIAKRSPMASSDGEDSIDVASSSEEGTSTSQVASAAAASGGSSVWWLSAIGLALCVGGGIMLVRRTAQKERNEDNTHL